MFFSIRCLDCTKCIIEDTLFYWHKINLSFSFFLLKMCSKFITHARFDYSLLCNCLILLYAIKFSEGAPIIICDGNGRIEEFSYEEWSLVQRIPSNGIEGVIVHADPPDACFPLSEPPNINNTLNWFVLIAGNSCDYDTKVLHSQLAGYSVAIIYKSERNNTNAFKPLLDYVPDIPAIIISENSACVIHEHYLYSINKSIRVLIYETYLDTLNLYHILIVSGFLLLVVYSLKFISFALLKRFGYYGTTALRHLPVNRYKKGDSYETCAICLEDFKIKERMRILPCLHGYHMKCIDPWLMKHQRTCPVCKQGVFLGPNTNVSHATETAPLMSNSSISSHIGNYDTV